MSEYQYYEFAALDRRLKQDEQAELRRYSSRAHITAGSFSNEYHWGDFKGDADEWMERYFDIHVYVANWGTHLLMLRLPRHCLPSQLFDYAEHSTGCHADSAFTARVVGHDCILSWQFSDDSGETWFEEEEQGSSWLSALQPLRDELRRGDLRALYLGWLARVDREEIGDDEDEPLLPPGLQALTPGQQALAEFLQLDPDWLSATAASSPPLSAEENTDDDIDTWLAQSDNALLKSTARLILQGDSQAAENALRSEYLDWQKKRSNGLVSVPRRSVDEISAGVETARHQRLDREKQRQAAALSRAAAERAARLARLALSAESIWNKIDQDLHTGSGSGYDRALKAIQELAEALSTAGREDEFRRGLVQLLSTHGKRKAWLARLERAGLFKP